MAERAAQTLGSIVRYWPLALLMTVAAAGLFALVAALAPATWTASARVVYAESSNALVEGTPTSTDVQRTLATQAELVTGDEVMGAASQDLNISQAELVSATTVTDLPGSDVLEISVEAESADGAAERAQRVAQGYVDYISEQARSNLENQADSLQTSIDLLRLDLVRPKAGDGTSSVNTALAALLQQQTQLNSAALSEKGAAEVISSAEPPLAPSSATPATAAVLGAAVGLVAACGVSLIVGRSRGPGEGRRRVGVDSGTTPTAVAREQSGGQ